uniref:L protein of photosystem II n=1 Tax=Karlodinium veneficum TaxID=407301 RepID=G1E794_KARVE|nr:L protein of photosystem II [Karlodinium veneficum]
MVKENESREKEHPWGKRLKSGRENPYSREVELNISSTYILLILVFILNLLFSSYVLN